MSATEDFTDALVLSKSFFSYFPDCLIGLDGLEKIWLVGSSAALQAFHKVNRGVQTFGLPSAGIYLLCKFQSCSSDIRFPLWSLTMTTCDHYSQSWSCFVLRYFIRGIPRLRARVYFQILVTSTTLLMILARGSRGGDESHWFPSAHNQAFNRLAIWSICIRRNDVAMWFDRFRWRVRCKVPYTTCIFAIGSRMDFVRCAK